MSKQSKETESMLGNAWSNIDKLLDERELLIQQTASLQSQLDQLIKDDRENGERIKELEGDNYILSQSLTEWKERAAELESDLTRYKGGFEDMERQCTLFRESLRKEQKRVDVLESLMDFVLNIHRMTTVEFCEAYKIEKPSWKGNVELASFEFITIDAIKWDKVKETAKSVRKSLTSGNEERSDRKNEQE